MSAPGGQDCRSQIHVRPVQAVVVGTFDCSKIGNSREPEPDSAYCLRCAVLLVDVGYFTPDDDTIEIPDPGDFLARRDRGEIDQNGAPR